MIGLELPWIYLLVFFGLWSLFEWLGCVSLIPKYYKATPTIQRIRLKSKTLNKNMHDEILGVLRHKNMSCKEVDELILFKYPSTPFVRANVVFGYVRRTGSGEIELIAKTFLIVPVFVVATGLSILIDRVLSGATSSFQADAPFLIVGLFAIWPPVIVVQRLILTKVVRAIGEQFEIVRNK